MKLKQFVKDQEKQAVGMDLAAPGDVSVGRLIDDSLVALHREVKNILIMSAKGKLDPATARDLRDHLKLLFELKDRENQSLRDVSDDDLAAAAQAALNKDQNETLEDSDPSRSGITTEKA